MEKIKKKDIKRVIIVLLLMCAIAFCDVSEVSAVTLYSTTEAMNNAYSTIGATIGLYSASDFCINDATITCSGDLGSSVSQGTVNRNNDTEYHYNAISISDWSNFTWSSGPTAITYSGSTVAYYGTGSIDGSVSLLWEDRAYTAEDGEMKALDVKVTISIDDVYYCGKTSYLTDSYYPDDVCVLLYNSSSTKGGELYLGSFHSGNGRLKFGVKMKVEIDFYYAGTSTLCGEKFALALTDLDTSDSAHALYYWYKNGSGSTSGYDSIANYVVAQGYVSTLYGNSAYQEKVWLPSSYTSYAFICSGSYLSSATSTSGRYVYGSQADSASIYSEVIFDTTSSGYFYWYGSACGTRLFYETSSATGTVTLTKSGGDGTNSLAGALYGVYNSSGTLQCYFITGSSTSTATGYLATTSTSNASTTSISATYNGTTYYPTSTTTVYLATGEYYVKELVAPSSGVYVLSSSASSSKTLSAGGSISFSVSDTVKGKITLTKSGGDETHSLAGALYQVTNSSGDVLGYFITGDGTSTVTGYAATTDTSSASTTSISATYNGTTYYPTSTTYLYISTADSYTVTEVVTPSSGYYLSGDAVTKSCALATTTAFSVSDSIGYGYLTLTKIGETVSGNDASSICSLAYAFFSVTNEDGEACGYFLTVANGVGYVASANEEDNTGMSLMANGEEYYLTLNTQMALDAGTYTITELIAPTGYALSDKSYTVDITSGTTTSITITDTLDVTYKIVFDSNKPSSASSDVEGDTSSMTGLSYDVSYSLTANGYSLTGWTWTGWNTEADGSGTSYTDEEEIINLTTENGGTITLYAQWTPITYTILFDGNTPSTASSSVTGSTTTMEGLSYDATYTLSANGYSLKYWEWTGWNTEADGSGTSYTDEEEIINLTTENGGTITLYAQWVKNTADLVIQKVDGDGNALSGAVFSLYSSDGTLIAEDLETGDDGYTDVIEGLSNGSYYLEETEAPDGYFLMSTELEFEIEEDDLDTTVTVVVNDNAIELLPSSGGGSTALPIAMSILIVLESTAAVLYGKTVRRVKKI